MVEIKLIGHSGCNLKISKYKKGAIVTKTSKNQEYNNRLKKQCKKQKMFNHDFFNAPLVFESGYDKNRLFKFSMEYINGLTLAEHFRNIEIGDIDDLAKSFFSIIPDNYSFDSNAKEIFISKLEDLKKKINIREDELLLDVFYKLKNYDWSYCIAGDCHGDMTLENVLFSDGNLYLIDFLDSFYNSWMVDMAKILQDVECKWSYRFDKKNDKNLEIRLLIFKQLLIDKILSLKDGEKILNTIFCILLVNLLRIIPYTDDLKTTKYLRNEISKIFKKINFI